MLALWRRASAPLPFYFCIFRVAEVAPGCPLLPASACSSFRQAGRQGRKRKEGWNSACSAVEAQTVSLPWTENQLLLGSPGKCSSTCCLSLAELGWPGSLFGTLNGRIGGITKNSKDSECGTRPGFLATGRFAHFRSLVSRACNRWLFAPRVHRARAMAALGIETHVFPALIPVSRSRPQIVAGRRSHFIAGR